MNTEQVSRIGMKARRTHGIDRAGALAYRNDVMVRRFADKYKISLANAEELFERCKAYLVVGALVNEPISPDVATDEMWHWFITYTQDYAAYCQEFFGHFIHHVPSDAPSGTAPADRARVSRAYAELGLATFTEPKNLLVQTSASCDRLRVSSSSGTLFAGAAHCSETKTEHSNCYNSGCGPAHCTPAPPSPPPTYESHCSETKTEHSNCYNSGCGSAHCRDGACSS